MRRAAEMLCPAQPLHISITACGEPRSLRATPDTQHDDRFVIFDSKIDQIGTDSCHSSPNVFLPDQRIGERVRGDAIDRGPDVCPYIERCLGIQSAIPKADPRRICDHFRIEFDLHGPKVVKAASTSSSLAKIPARDRARARMSEARSSSSSVSQIEGSAALSGAGSSRSVAPDSICGPMDAIGWIIAHPCRPTPRAMLLAQRHSFRLS